MMTRKAPVLCLLGLVLLNVNLPGQTQPATTGPDVFPADPRIVEALKQVSAQRIQATIEKLVSFQTRLTLSAQDPASIAAGHGIGAAREWIKSEFERYSQDCGGCLEVKTDAFLEPAGDRIPKPTEITNVYAVLKGGDAENAKRIVLVTGHYDSRNSDTLDAAGIAPGANDDASGTAVSLECARVLSKMKFPATIIFLAVAGEEQGLNGSHHFARMAKEQGWDIEAVLNNDIVGGDKNPQQDSSVVRVFSEGVPVAASEADLRLIRNLGGENDSPSRELARYITEVGRAYDGDVRPYWFSGSTATCAAAITIHSTSKVLPRCVSPNSAKTIIISTRMFVRRMASSMATRLKFVNFDYVASVARLNAATLASLASAPAPPAKVHLLTKELENDSTLAWEASAGGEGRLRGAVESHNQPGMGTGSGRGQRYPRDDSALEG